MLACSYLCSLFVYVVISFFLQLCLNCYLCMYCFFSKLVVSLFLYVLLYLLV